MTSLKIGDASTAFSALSPMTISNTGMAGAGNVITNIKKRLFESVQKGRRFEISARNHKFKHIYNHYSDIVDFNIPIESRNNEGQGLVVFNSSEYLEIAVYRSNLATVGSASSLLGLNMLDTISIKFIKN